VKHEHRPPSDVGRETGHDDFTMGHEAGHDDFTAGHEAGHDATSRQAIGGPIHAPERF
jgi:hypothetical protein